MAASRKTKRAIANCSDHVSCGSSSSVYSRSAYQGSSKVDAGGTSSGAVQPLRLAEGQTEYTFAGHDDR